MRVAFVLRSAEVQPLFKDLLAEMWRWDPVYRLSSHAWMLHSDPQDSPLLPNLARSVGCFFWLSLFGCFFGYLYALCSFGCFLALALPSVGLPFSADPKLRVLGWFGKHLRLIPPRLLSSTRGEEAKDGKASFFSLRLQSPLLRGFWS